MRILLVEDSEESARRVIDGCPRAEWTWVQTRDEALAALDGEAPDVIVCDLRIPPSRGDLVPDPKHGLAVFDACRERWPGVPTLILSGFTRVEMIDARFPYEDRKDYRGNGLEPMAWHKKKDDIAEVVDYLNGHVSDLEALAAEIEIAWGSAPEVLSEADARLIRIYAKSRRASLVKARRLQQGKSGAKTLALDLRQPYGRGAKVVVKLNEISEVQDEYRRYSEYVADQVAIGRYPHSGALLVAGGRTRGALFYQLGDGFDRNMFDVLRSDPEKAAEVVMRLQAATANWQGAPHVRTVPVAEVRRRLVSDTIREDLLDLAPWATEELEDLRLEVNEIAHHGDLHGENILVDAAGLPLLIDFGRTSAGYGAIDPVTLEISAILHPSAGLELGTWLSDGRVEFWADFEAYADESPIKPFLRACRAWATDQARGDRELLAVAYAFALRQLRYPDTDQELACALSLGAARALRRSYTV